ncbi:MAG: cytochrome c3 family protein [Candidatus Zixiibacteriota bacterium]
MKLKLSAFIGVLLLFMIAPMISAKEEIDRDVLIKESATCLDCHDMAASLASSAHRLSDAKAPMPVAVGCIGCHDGWKVHIEDPSRDNITNPRSLSNFDQAGVCGRCHLNPHQSSMYSSDPHSRTDVGCLSCHKVHDNHNRFLVKDDGDNYCGSCHTSVLSEFKRRSVHPLESGNIGCTDCHYSGDNQDRLFAAGVDWSCQKCHTDQAGPYIHEHPVVYEHLVEGNGCTQCHEPHGSANDRLLKQAGDGICTQCHGVPPLHRTQHSGLGSKMACVDCHSMIHGSNENDKFLDPDLGVKLFPDCYQSGCHDINR